MNLHGIKCAEIFFPRCAEGYAAASHTSTVHDSALGARARMSYRFIAANSKQKITRWIPNSKNCSISSEIHSKR